MIVGYARVSTLDQDLERQIYNLGKYGVEKIFTDKRSGKDTKREGLKEMLSFIREGDILIVDSFDRLARNTRDLLELSDEFQNKKVIFKSLKEGIDTETPTGKFMLTIFGAVAQLERSFINERQKEGIEIAKANGRHLGRPKAEYPRNFKSYYMKYKNGKLKAVEFMRLTGLKKTTFYKLIKEYEKEIINCNKTA